MQRRTEIKRVTVLVGEWGAHAMAAGLTLKELEVTICEAPEFKEGFRTTLERQSIELIDLWGEEKEVKIHKATQNQRLKSFARLLRCGGLLPLT